ncbi:IS5 family transposase ISOt6 [Orientia tsutsugamushi]|uniref:IS5 family transposase ISOt6 n=1 Tax=Orientia tsutsugamushi TaxID=784 RepID=A0A2U3RTG0_ORITS|nr:IS5 family transposase ISOt6 [Orientia tsutsugamushi]
MNENIIGMLKRFKIIADKYRNRCKRFGLRFNLISAIYNFELPNQFRKRSIFSCKPFALCFSCFPLS